MCLRIQWFTTAVKKHKTAVRDGQPACVHCFNVYWISSVLVAEEHGVTLVLAYINNLLNQF